MDDEHESDFDYEIMSTDSDSEESIGYAEIFQRLVSGYLVGNVSLHKGYKSPRPPNFKYKTDLTDLENSEFAFVTQQSAGLLNRENELGTDVTRMILNREKGLYTNTGFSSADKCRILNNFLPNSVKLFCTYGGKVFCGTFSKSGKYFITASQDQLLRIYNSSDEKYKKIKTVKAIDLGWSIIDVAFSPDEQFFAYSTWSTSLQICPVDKDDDRQTALNLVKSGRRFCVFSVAFSSDGREVLGGANDGYLYIYDRQRNARTGKIQAHEYDVNSVVFADNSSHIIYSGGDDGLLKVWDRRTLNEESPTPVGTLAGHMDGITYINSRGDGKHFISNSKDQSIKLWDVRQFSSDLGVQKTLQAVHEQNWDYRWQGVPKKLYNKDKLAGDSSVMTYRGHIVSRTLVRCRFSPIETTGQRFIYTGCGNGRLVIYDALTGKMKEYSHHKACVRDVDWHPHRNEILTSSWDCSVGFWQYKDTYSSKTPKKDRVPDNIRRSLRLAMKNN